MIKFLWSFLNRKPERYGREIEARFYDVHIYDVVLQSGDQLFTHKHKYQRELIHYVFVFDLDGQEHYFKREGKSPKPPYEKGEIYQAWLHSGHNNSCWINGWVCNVFVSEPEDDEDYI